MRLISAIVLLFWAVCSGRCLAEQYGLLNGFDEQVSTYKCCGQEEPGEPAAPEASPCEVCEFIKTGSVTLNEPLLSGDLALACLRILDDHWIALLQKALIERGELLIADVDTGPPGGIRLCEWMASTAMPVRGPNGMA